MSRLGAIGRPPALSAHPEALERLVAGPLPPLLPSSPLVVWARRGVWELKSEKQRTRSTRDVLNHSQGIPAKSAGKSNVCPHGGMFKI
eukprot:scaffold10_cov257-Pinguiococcus_pyrenoidosus.AAC.61